MFDIFGIFGIDIFTMCKINRYNKIIIKNVEDTQNIKKNKSIEVKVNVSLDNLPAHIEEIKLGYNYNEPINNLPVGLKKLNCGFNFNQKLDFLPETLEELIINSRKYEHSLKNLPSGLKKLELIFLKSIDSVDSLDYLPHNLEELKVTDTDKAKLDNLPINLKKLDFSNYNGDLDFLPKKLESLIICSSSITSYENLPKNLQNLVLMDVGDKINTLPNSLKYLELEDFHGEIINFPLNLEKIKIGFRLIDREKDYHKIFPFSKLPASIKYLELGMFVGEVNNLPPNLECLILSDFGGKLINIPKSLKKIINKKLYTAPSLKTKQHLMEIKKMYGNDLELVFE